MELRRDTPKELYPVDVNVVEDYFEVALYYAEGFYKPTLDHFRSVSLADLTPEKFWNEYIWCVYTSGFNARVISRKFLGLLEAYGEWNDFDRNDEEVWSDVSGLIANENKFAAVWRTRTLIEDLGIDIFFLRYLQRIDDLVKLPFIGKITKYHLARNLGFDCVKPDLHLVRLAERFGFGDPEAMCAYLSGLSGERIGVVDFVLWSFAADFGSKE